MTSILLWSSRWRDGRLRWVSNVLVVTRAPASRQILAAARSKGHPRPLRTPDRGHAARWSPKGSRTRRHRQERSVRGKGRRRRRRSRRRNKWEGKRKSSEYGMVVKTLLACGPDWDASMAWLAGSNVASNSFVMAARLAAEAGCCHPLVKVGGPGLSLLPWRGGLAPRRSCSKSGGAQPACVSCSVAACAAWSEGGPLSDWGRKGWSVSVRWDACV